jgi:hypothetical protein
MGLAGSSKVSFLLLFDVIPEPFPFVVKLPSVSAQPWHPPCHESRSGVSRDLSSQITVSLVQIRKTIPAEGCAVCACRRHALDLVTMPGVDHIRTDETQEYQNRQYSQEQKRDHERLPSSPL